MPSSKKNFEIALEKIQKSNSPLFKGSLQSGAKKLLIDACSLLNLVLFPEVGTAADDTLLAMPEAGIELIKLYKKDKTLVSSEVSWEKEMIRVLHQTVILFNEKNELSEAKSYMQEAIQLLQGMATNSAEEETWKTQKLKQFQELLFQYFLSAAPLEIKFESGNRPNDDELGRIYYNLTTYVGNEHVFARILLFSYLDHYCKLVEDERAAGAMAVVAEYSHEDLTKIIDALIREKIETLPDNELEQKAAIQEMMEIIEQTESGGLLYAFSQACLLPSMTEEIAALAHRSTAGRSVANKVMASYCYLALSERDDFLGKIDDNEKDRVTRLFRHPMLGNNAEAKERCNIFLTKLDDYRKQSISVKPIEKPRELAARIDHLAERAISAAKDEEAAKELKELAMTGAPYFYACLQYLSILEKHGEEKKTQVKAEESGYYFTKASKCKQTLYATFRKLLDTYIEFNDPFALEYGAVARKEGSDYLSRHPVLARNYFMRLLKLEPHNELARAALIDMQMNGEGGFFDVEGATKLLPIRSEDAHNGELAYQAGEYWVLQGHLAQHYELHHGTGSQNSADCFARARDFFEQAGNHKLAQLALSTLEHKPLEAAVMTDRVERESGYDTDIQQDAAYHQASGPSSRPQSYTGQITKLLEQSALHFLNRLKDNTLEDETAANMQQEAKSLFSSVTSPDSWNADVHDQEKRDLVLLNHYYSKGNLLEGLQQLCYRYQVAQLRGIYFSTRSWSLDQIETYKKIVKTVLSDTQRPLHDMPIFSAAVYEHAGITNRVDFNEETKQRLMQSARFVGYQLRALQKLKPWQNLEGDNPDAPVQLKTDMSKFLQQRFDNRLEQLQQLYTNNLCTRQNYIVSEITA